MTFASRAREARINAAMATLADPTASPHDVAQAKAAIASGPTDLRKLDDHELSLWIFLREKLAGREPESDVFARSELAAHCQALADALAATAEATPTEGTRPVLPGCRRCARFSDEDLRCLREALDEDDVIEAEPVAALPEGDDHGGK